MRVIENPVSGERILIRRSGAQTGGELLSFELMLPPGAHVPARHAHPSQEEVFTVLAGRIRFRVGSRRLDAGPGDTVRIPSGTSHWFGNSTAEVARARVEVRPALRLEELFAATEVIGQSGGRIGRQPRISDLAALLLEYQPEVAAPRVPGWLARALLAVPAWFGRRRQRRERGQQDPCAGPS
ncbi:MAG: cupin domain-containing protein [Candidatus Dormibacteria bacterium]